MYKLLGEDEPLPEDETSGNLAVHYHHTKSLGINGLVDTRILNPDVDALVYFADTQLSVPEIYRWCKKNSVVFIPYIGVIESHSTNKVIRFVMNSLFRRNVAVYKKVTCLVKNEDVRDRLSLRGVQNSVFAPVGIDLELLNSDFEQTSQVSLRKKYGYGTDEKIILFIGRLVEEKHPLELIKYFQRLYKKDDSYRLIIVGKGELKEPLQALIEENELNSYVRYFESIPNNQIWELYRIASAFVNLNRQEIFGMVLLEAMYYKVKVVAWHAPGPDYIIQDGVSGFLVSDEDSLIEAIEKRAPDIGTNAHNRIVNDFTWDKTASSVLIIAAQRGGVTAHRQLRNVYIPESVAA
ncbi:MAG: glycosyltransferase [Oscillospiraceae bacterium]|nr:glycosyltransferase [Oscillospiraceae bacterium]